MTVLPLQLGRLQHVERANRTVVLAAAARFGSLEKRLTVRLPPFGDVSLRCLSFSAPQPPDPDDAVWGLARDNGDGRRGYLLLTNLTALRIVSVNLGLPIPRISRRLGAAERGAASATIATVLRAAARDTTVGLPRTSWTSDGLVRVSIAMDLGRFRERARLDVPSDWIPRDSASLVENLTRRDLRVTLCLELSRTALMANAWSQAQVGDAVVFDETSGPRLDRNRAVQLVCGNFAADARLSEEGRITVLSAFRDAGGTRESMPHKPTTGSIDTMSNNEHPTIAHAVLAAAPIEIVAEIGRIVLRADEVIALGPGSILEVGPLRPTAVDLRVGDRTWASGELVDVEGQLGVRLIALRNHADPRNRSDNGDADDAETLR